MVKFSRVFDNNNFNWSTESMAINEAFVKHKIQYWYSLLTYRGWIFLDEVYKSLGFVPTVESLTYGWAGVHTEPNIITYTVLTHSIRIDFFTDGDISEDCGLEHEEGVNVQ